MPNDSTAEGPSEFRAIVFITEELGKFLALFFGGFTHAWGVNTAVFCIMIPGPARGTPRWAELAKAAALPRQTTRHARTHI